LAVFFVRGYRRGRRSLILFMDSRGGLKGAKRKKKENRYFSASKYK